MNDFIWFFWIEKINWVLFIWEGFQSIKKNISWTWEIENTWKNERINSWNTEENKNDWKYYYLWYFKNWNFFVVSEDSEVDWWWERWALEKWNLLYKDIFDSNYQKFLEAFKL